MMKIYQPRQPETKHHCFSQCAIRPFWEFHPSSVDLGSSSEVLSQAIVVGTCSPLVRISVRAFQKLRKNVSGITSSHIEVFCS